jgi:imidazolonepropionase
LTRPLALTTLPESSDIVDVDHVENLGGALVTPGLIDAHSHPVYAGNRWAELAMRSGGSSMTEINSAGGGLSSTVTVTRGTDPWTLCNHVRGRMRDWLLSGTTTIEAKTGYHLTRDGELADVRLLRSLEDEPGIPRLHVTFFAAHAVPPEYFGRRNDYVDAVSSWCADAAAAGADSIDVHCDDGHFNEAESRWILKGGRAAGLLRGWAAIRGGAARLAAGGCASPTCSAGPMTTTWPCSRGRGHCRRLPGEYRENGRTAPVGSLLDRCVMVVLGIGHSPGTNGIASMPLVITLAIANLGMSVTEALRAATVGGAHALRAPDRGAMTRGRLADVVAWDADHEGAFAWSYGLRPYGSLARRRTGAGLAGWRAWPQRGSPGGPGRMVAMSDSTASLPAANPACSAWPSSASAAHRPPDRRRRRATAWRPLGGSGQG